MNPQILSSSLKRAKNLKLWSHWHTFPGLFLNTLVVLHTCCTSCFPALGNSSGLACHINRTEILRAVEKTKEFQKPGMMNLGSMS